MIGLIQRVKTARVEVGHATIAQIDSGLSLFLGIDKDDDLSSVEPMVKKVIGYRVFPDATGHMNLSLGESGGGLLIVSQFTLVADTRRGLRPSFSSAASQENAKTIYDAFVDRAKTLHDQVETGIFAANMQVTLCNDGPVSFILRS